MNHDMSGRKNVVAAIGEVLWDVFPTGPRLGGAPANFACAMAGLANVSVEMISAVGKDELGVDSIKLLKSQNVGTKLVARLEQPTGQVNISLDPQGVASYEFVDDCAWDNVAWSESLSVFAKQTDVVCFGSLGQRTEVSRNTIQRFVRSTASDCLRIFDINLRPPFYSTDVIRESLEIANMLKLNDEELTFLAELFELQGNEQELVAQIADVADLHLIAMTRGENGAMIFKDGKITDCVGVTTEVVDTVGAGDAYTAAMIAGLLAGNDIEAINQNACQVAAFVCSQAGATPVIPTKFAIGL